MLQMNNWSSYQSYKDRRPPWIRFHKTILDNYDFQKMSANARALLPMLWLLASEDEDPLSGLIKTNYEKIAFRLRISEKDVVSGIKECVAGNFIVEIQPRNESVTKPYPIRNETVTPETEAEAEAEAYSTDREETDNMSDFESLWKMYPRRDGSKQKAKELYKKALKEGATHGQIADGVRRYAEKLRAEGTEQRFIAHCTTWLNGKRWEADYTIETKGNEWADATKEYIASLSAGQG